MRSMLAATLFVLVALAGCAETTPPAAPDAVEPTDSGDLDDEVNTTVPVVVFAADVVNGTAPLTVNFTVDALNATDALNGTWSIDFGDGNSTNGTGLPATASHTFSPGNFTSLLSLTVDGAALNASLATTVASAAPAEVPRELPEKLSWSFGPSLGCAGDTGTCISLEIGPGEPAIDGFYVPLDELYWGLPFTSTVGNVRADSDCWFVGADGHTPIGEANNSDKPCAGVVPVNTAYIFVYSYAEPSQSITLSFTV